MVELTADWRVDQMVGLLVGQLAAQMAAQMVDMTVVLMAGLWVVHSADMSVGMSVVPLVVH